MDDKDLKGQAKVIDEVRHRVDAWRGFALGPAAEPYPTTLPRYQPVLAGEHELSPTASTLLHHWFRSEPHFGKAYPDGFKYWPHQRRAVETFIYLYEVCGIRRTQDLYKLTGVDPLAPQNDPWAKIGAELATGAGKTKVMSLLVAWAYLDAVCEPDSTLGFGQHSLIIAPGLFVRDRLMQDFRPSRGTPVFFQDPVIPPELESYWRLKVYSPVDCPRELDPGEGALVVTNYHQLLRTLDDELEERPARQVDLLFEAGEPAKLGTSTLPLIERFRRSSGLLVINDEAHHVWDEPGHLEFERKQKNQDGPDADASMAWIRSIRKLNAATPSGGRVALQVDLSATLYQETGATKTKARKGEEKVSFKARDWFRHTAVHYGLADAIRDGIVKKPILERVEARNTRTGDPEPLVRDGSPNAWEKYRTLLCAGIERWKKVKVQLEAEGDPRKPILFIIANDQKEAREVANYLSHGDATGADLSHLPPTGYREENGDVLFLSEGLPGERTSTVVQIHIGKKEESSEEAWEEVRQAVNAVDQNEFIDGAGKVIANPYNVVVSVMMLKEGWDVRNVKVIVPLRPCDSRTLTEQVLGRGLRKMHAPVLDEDGGATLRPEELYVIQHPSFKAILDQVQDIIEERASDDIDHTPEYLPIRQRDEIDSRRDDEVRLLKLVGSDERPVDWTEGLVVDDFAPLSPRLAWIEELGDTEIKTFLLEALRMGEREGQKFILPQTPSYSDFDDVLERAYVLPLLQQLRQSYQYKLACKRLVREFLEQKTFALAAGLPISFDRALSGGFGRIALGNLARSEVIVDVRKALLPRLQQAIGGTQRQRKEQPLERNAVDLGDYQAIRKHVLEAPKRTTFDRAAVENHDELRVARLLESAVDVHAWLYNHRRGVGFSIEYVWQGRTSLYFPDFIVRARIEHVFHNFIIEVKGRLDERDRRKAEHGRIYCDRLTASDHEPWHYLFVVENDPLARLDIAWWEGQSIIELQHLARYLEQRPMVPQEAIPPKLEILAARPRGMESVPVYDLAAAAGGFSDGQSPEVIGWARLPTPRPIDGRFFIAKIAGRSMEPGIPSGSMGLFRFFPHGEEPMLTALDGRRVLLQLRDITDPDSGGAFTIKRLRVGPFDAEGRLVGVQGVPDNHAFDTIHVGPDTGELRVIAQFLEVVG